MAFAQQPSTIVGVFEEREQADNAVSDLLNAGFRQDQIGVAMRRDEDWGDVDTSRTDGEGEGSHAGSGAVAGALTGLGLGTLAGLGVLAGVVPVVGPAIAAGTLGIILSNAAAGAGIAGLVGALIGAGIPEHEAQYYHSEFEAGRTIVTVTANGRADEAIAILRRYGAYDVNNRRTPGETLANPASTADWGSRSRTDTADLDDDEISDHNVGTLGRDSDTIELKEERLRAEKRPVEKGAVTVRKEVRTENKTIEVPVQREEVIVERTPVRGRATAESFDASDLGEGQQIRIPVREDQVNVSKEAVVTEQVKVGKRTVQDTERVSGQVRKEDVKIEQTGDIDVKTPGSTKGTNRP